MATGEAKHDGKNSVFRQNWISHFIQKKTKLIHSISSTNKCSKTATYFKVASSQHEHSPEVKANESRPPPSGGQRAFYN